MIEFSYPCGSKTMAKTAAMALRHWHGLQLPFDWSQVKPLEVFVQSRPSLKDGSELIDMSIAAAERSVNKSPHLDSNNSFEEQCRQFLLWLAEEKLILNLVHNGELDPPA